MQYARIGYAAVLPALITACGGGGGGAAPLPSTAPGSATIGAPGAGGTANPSPSATTSAPAATPTPVRVTMAGTVLQLPSDAYGPIAIGANVYASTDATQTAAIAGATVVIGPVPVTGATAPATLPAGDVAATTAANGAFTVTLDVAPAPPSSSEPFVIPQNNILGFALPASGYYIAAFGPGSDGLGAGKPIPLHRFISVTPAATLRITQLASTEAAAIAALNATRATLGASTLIADESAEEVARLHASDESANAYTCHYDTHNVGPSSRFLAAGGSGLTGEALALSYGPDATSAFANSLLAFDAEGTQTPPGAHYLNLVDPTHAWLGVAAIAAPSAPGFFNIDDEFVTPDAQSAVVGSSGYPAGSTCPAGTTNNDS